MPRRCYRVQPPWRSACNDPPLTVDIYGRSTGSIGGDKRIINHQRIAWRWACGRNLQLTVADAVPRCIAQMQGKRHVIHITHYGGCGWTVSIVNAAFCRSDTTSIALPAVTRFTLFDEGCLQLIVPGFCDNKGCRCHSSHPMSVLTGPVFNSIGRVLVRCTSPLNGLFSPVDNLCLNFMRS